MNLYLIHQSENGNYDTFDSAVVSAQSEEEARLIHPAGDGYTWDSNKEGWYGIITSCYADSTWTDPKHVKVSLIGQSLEEAGVVLASFNAG